MKTFIHRALLASLLLGLASLGGCADTRIGRSFNPNLADELQPNLTSRGDARSLLGAPIRSHTVGDVVIDTHKYVTPSSFSCVYVSYRGDKVMHVTRVR